MEINIKISRGWKNVFIFMIGGFWGSVVTSDIIMQQNLWQSLLWAVFLGCLFYLPALWVHCRDEV